MRASGYYINMGTDNPPTNIYLNRSLGLTEKFTPTGLIPGFFPFLDYVTLSNTYYVQIVPYNLNGSASNCPISNFTLLPKIQGNFIETFDNGGQLPYGWVNDFYDSGKLRVRIRELTDVRRRMVVCTQQL